MTTSRSAHPCLTAPVVDYEPAPIEPAPIGTAPPCPPPLPAAIHRHTPRPMSPATRPVREAPAPRAAAVFADTALRRVLEVVDRRRPIAALRALLSPNLIDMVAVVTRFASTDGAAVLRRVRLRSVGIGAGGGGAGADEPTPAGEPTAAEVFAIYTRGKRVRAIAGRVEVVGGAWKLVALQIG